MAKTITLNGHNFTLMSPRTLRAFNYTERWKSATYENLRQVYVKWSDEKEDALKRCNKIAYDFDKRCKILTHCVRNFTCGFVAKVEEKTYLIVFTYVNDYAIPLD